MPLEVIHAHFNIYGNLTHIQTRRGYTYERRAWTGGDRPPIGWDREERSKDLIEALYYDQIKSASNGGTLNEMQVLMYWEESGTSSEERKSIFMNRALLDAWRTLNP